MKKKELILSAGIDIGTSTTKLIISQFSLMNVAGTTHVPRIEITDKEILYKSPVYRTPLKDDVTIDTAAVESLIKHEYEQAEINPSQIETGAVIITGEAATKTNASHMIHQLSKEAGDFLVATAGPDLEGIIAAKGSGAFDYSEQSERIIANIDIGGGTANIAVVKNKQLLGTCTLHIGGRLIEFSNGKVGSISPPIERLILNESRNLNEGDSSEDEAVVEIIDRLIETLIRALNKELEPVDDCLLLGAQPTWKGQVDTILFSGGIAECIYKQEDSNLSPASYDDIGQTLADRIQLAKGLGRFDWLTPKETVRATVLGAGTQTTEISGATIQIDPEELPLKNIPIFKYRFHFDFELGLESIEHAFKQAINLYDSTLEGQNFALFLSELPHLGFHDITKLAQKMHELMNLRIEKSAAMILIIESDIAKVLGQSLQAMKVPQSVVCIDQIKVDNGDYIDIGRSLESGVVPVVVKTLTFHSS